MKKSAITTAILLAIPFSSVFANTSVTLSGIVKGGVTNTQYSNGESNNGSGFGVSDGSSTANASKK